VAELRAILSYSHADRGEKSLSVEFNSSLLFHSFELVQRLS